MTRKKGGGRLTPLLTTVFLRLSERPMIGPPERKRKGLKMTKCFKCYLDLKDREQLAIALKLKRAPNQSRLIKDALRHYLITDQPDKAPALRRRLESCENANETLGANVAWLEERNRELVQQVEKLTADNRMLGAALKAVSNDPRQIGKLRSILEKQKDQRGN